MPTDEHELRARRHIEGTICKACHGWGGIWYPNTATWRRGGFSGQAFTWDVCDTCWGSGDSDATWTDLRKLRDEEAQRVNDAAANLLAGDCGQGLRSLRNAQLALADIIEALGKKRKLPQGVDTFAWHPLTSLLVKRLRAFAATSSD
jgi:hypothetical protein